MSAGTRELREGRYKMCTFSTVTGFSPEKLRTWERRYDLLEPERLPGGHRVYTEHDRQVMAAVAELLEAGHPIGEIALIGRAELRERGRPAASAEVAARRAGHPAGTTWELVAEGLWSAAGRLDADAIQAQLDDAFALASAGHVVRELLAPVAARIASTDALSIAGRRLLTQALRVRLERLFDVIVQRTGRAPLTVVSSLPEDELGLCGFFAAFACASVGERVVRFDALPLTELADVVAALSPDKLVVTAGACTALIESSGALRRLAQELAPRTTLHLGGLAATEPDPMLIAAGVVYDTPRHDPAPAL